MTDPIRVLAGLALILTATPAAGATLCVNPAGSDGCHASIQAAVDASASRDVIDVAAGTYVGSVFLNDVGRITIRGAGPGATIIESSPGAEYAVGTFGRRTDVTLGGVTLRNGGGGVSVGEFGRFLLRDCVVEGHARAAIRTGLRSKVTVEDCVITGNGGAAGIGAWGTIASRGTSLTIVRSDVRDNDAMGIVADRKVTIVDSAIRGNTFGGVNASSGSLTGSTVSGNGPWDAVSFGHQFRGTATIANTTISGNGGTGLAVPDGSAARLDQVTIAGNGAGGIRAVGARLTIKASIVADNVPDDCSNVLPGYVSTMNLVGVNLIETPAGCTLRGVAPLAIDPLLGPLQNNGGPTETRAPLPGSAAIGARATACSGGDQRGVTRTLPCDLGAYETP